MKFNKRELKLIDDIRSCEAYISGNNELEMNLRNYAWYANEYNGSESVPIDYIDYPLITEDEIEDNDVDVYAVFDYCHVAYCG